MNVKAAGFWVALVLTLGPALVAFLRDASGQGWVDAGVAGLVILLINGLVKYIQVSGTETNEQPPVPLAPGAIVPMASPMPEQTKGNTRFHAWLLG